MNKLFMIPLVAIVLLGMGCVMARGPGGEVIIGVPIGTLIETANEGITAVANTWIPGLGTLIAGSLTATGGVTGTVMGIGAAMRRRAAERVAAEMAAKAEAMDRKRKKADQEREFAATELAVALAKLEAASPRLIPLVGAE